MDRETLLYLQNKLDLEASHIRQEYGFASEKENPSVFVNLNYEEILALQTLVNDAIKKPAKEFPV